MVTSGTRNTVESGQIPSQETPGQFSADQNRETRRAVEERQSADSGQQSQEDQRAAADIIKKIQAGEAVDSKGEAVLDRSIQQFVNGLKGDTPKQKARDLLYHLANPDQNAFEAQAAIKLLIDQESEQRKQNASLN